MTKYLTEERFIVNSTDPTGRKNYADNYDRIFGSDAGAAVGDVDTAIIDKIVAGPLLEARVGVGPNVTIYARPENVNIGWTCPTCCPIIDDGSDALRFITAIDQGAGYYECETRHAHKSDDTIRHDYRPKLA
jgi:hypothetical protein